MSEISTKPYLIRAIYDWCADNGYTPYLAVKVDDYTQVPMAFVKDGEIVLNISVDAVQNLQMGNEDITCAGRFGGVPHRLIIPVEAVIGIFSKETGQGLVFQGQASQTTRHDGDKEPPTPPVAPPSNNRPKLRIVK